MKKTIIFVLIGILAITLGVIVGINLNDEEKVKEVSGGNVINTSNKNESVISNTQNNIENNVVENVIENEEEEKKEEPKTDLEIAIDIAKKEWGTEEGVKFSFEEKIQSGEYIICVREISTTNALVWYKVNIEHETCED